MPDDVTSYSLNLMLTLSSNASVVLGDVETSLGKINDQISQIASSYNSALGGAAQGFAGANEQIAENLTEANKQLDQTQPILEDMADLQKERMDGLEKEVDWHAELEDSLVKEADSWEDMMDPSEAMRDNVEDIAEGTGDIGNGMDKVVSGSKKAAKGFFGMFLSLEAVKTAFAEFIALEEDFNLASYRLYGAQEQIVGQVGAISTEYGVLRETALEAVKSLAISLRVPREQLSKYAGQVAAFNTATGASIQQTSDWTRSMVLAGFSARDTERSLGRMVLMMRQAGFTTDQINKHLQQQTDSIGYLSASYTKEGVEAWNAGTMAMSTLAREVGGNVDAMMALEDVLISTPAAMSLFASRSNIAEEAMAGMNKGQKDLLRSASGMLDYFADVDARTKGLSPEVAKITFGAYGKAIDLTAAQMSHMNMTAKKLREELGMMDPEKLLERMLPMIDGFKAQNALTVELADSMNTVGRQWKENIQPLSVAWINLMIALKPVMLYIIDLVGVLVDVLSFLINTLAAIINPVASFNKELDETVESGEEAVGFFKRLGSGVINFGKALPGVVIGVAALVGLYVGFKLIAKLFTDWVNQMRSANLRALSMAFLSIGASALMMAGALAIIAALGWKAASSLAILAVAMTGMTVAISFMAKAASGSSAALAKLAAVILAFGAASLMIAGSLWIMADAMKTMADLGWLLIGAVTAVVVILLAVSAALAVVAYVAAPVAPVILAIGAAFLMVGASIWLVAKSFEMIINSFIRLFGAVSLIADNAKNIMIAVGVISAALLTLGYVGGITAIPLLALGIALTVVGVAAYMIASAFEAAAGAVKAFSDIGNVKAAVEGMSYAMTAMMFTMAGIAIVLAPVLPLMVIAAGVMVAVAGAAWLTAKAMEGFVKAMDGLSDLERVNKAVDGLVLAIKDFAYVSLLVAPALPAMVLMGVAMLAVGAGAWLMVKAMEAISEAIDDFANISMDDIWAMGKNMVAFGAALVVSAIAIGIGAGMMLPAAAAAVIGLGALKLALKLAPTDVIEDLGNAFVVLAYGLGTFATIDHAKLKDTAIALGDFGIAAAGAGAKLLSATATLVPGIAGFAVAMVELAIALWLVPLTRLKSVAIAMMSAGRGIKYFASSLDSVNDVNDSISQLSGSVSQLNDMLPIEIGEIGEIGASFDQVGESLSSVLDGIEAQAAATSGGVAEALSSALDGIEAQALRADGLVSSFASLNEVLAEALSGPPEPVYGGVADALRGRLDAIEEQIARAESIYAPIENLAEQAELAASTGTESAPEAVAETISGTANPSEEEDHMAASNFKNIRQQTELLTEILERMPPEEIASGLESVVDKIKGAIDYLGEIVEAIPGVSVDRDPDGTAAGGP